MHDMPILTREGIAWKRKRIRRFQGITVSQWDESLPIPARISSG